jgi:hypothetical protein
MQRFKNNQNRAIYLTSPIALFLLVIQARTMSRDDADRRDAVPATDALLREGDVN